MNGLFLTEQEKKSLALRKLRSGFRVATLEDAEEFIRVAQENVSTLSEEKLLEMLTYTGMFHADGTLKEEFT